MNPVINKILEEGNDGKSIPPLFRKIVKANFKMTVPSVNSEKRKGHIWKQISYKKPISRVFTE